MTAALCLAAMILPAAASSVKLAWNPNPEPNIVNYRLSYGTGSRSYSQSVDSGTATTVAVSGLEQGKTYYFSVRAINDKGFQSEPSAEVSHYVEIPAPANQAPVANDQTVTTDEDTAVAITLSASDADGDALTYTIVSGPTMGSLSGNAPNLTYTPHPDVNGSDSFTFLASDGTANSNTATVAITITPGNAAPVAAGQTVTTDEDTAVAITLSASDADGDSLTYTIVNGPTMGSLSGNAPNLTYTPHPDVNGSDSFTFHASDGTANSNTATVAITIKPVNDAPVAAAQMVMTAEDRPVGILLSATDKDGDPLTYQIVSAPTKGLLTGTAPNLIYTPHPDVNGSDSFSFRANDGTVNSNTATVSITITSVNDAPVAADQQLATAADQALSITLTAIDVDGDPLSYRIVSAPIKGKLSGTAPKLTYTPYPDVSGSDSFSFRANDGTVDSNTATVFITLTVPQKAENKAPVFQSAKISRESGNTDSAYSAESLAGTAIDPEGEVLAYSKASGPEWLIVSANGDLSGTPPEEAAGLNAFTIRASDPQGASAEAILEIEIQSGDLPLPWTLARIGDIRPDSTAAGDAGSITISSSGIFSAEEDNQLFTWQTLTGDGEITARVTAIQNASSQTLVGVAIRESLAPNAKHNFMGVKADGSFTLLRRTSTGGLTTQNTSGSGSLPKLWVRLVRKGNIITSFRSNDGFRWNSVARTNLSLGASCYIGLAVYGGSDSLSTGEFKNITITP